MSESPRLSKYVTEVMKTLPTKSPEERLKTIMAFRSGEDRRFFSSAVEEQMSVKSVERVSAHRTLVIFRFKVDRYYTNGMGNLHGGAQATIFDMATSIAVQAFGEGSWINGGVSRTLNVTYLRPAPEGADLLLEVEIVHMGKNMSLTRAVLKRESDGAIISTCEHNKAGVSSKL